MLRWSLLHAAAGQAHDQAAVHQVGDIAAAFVLAIKQVPLLAFPPADRIGQLPPCLRTTLVEHVEDLHLADSQVLRPAARSREGLVRVDPFFGQRLEAFALELLAGLLGDAFAVPLVRIVRWQFQLAAAMRNPAPLDRLLRMTLGPRGGDLRVAPAGRVLRSQELVEGRTDHALHRLADTESPGLRVNEMRRDAELAADGLRAAGLVLRAEQAVHRRRPRQIEPLTLDAVAIGRTLDDLGAQPHPPRGLRGPVFRI
jgi:hypothetical protein